MKRNRRRALFALVTFSAVGISATQVPGLEARQFAIWPARFGHSDMAPLAPKSKAAARITAGAKSQIGTRYDASYREISYPMGDVDAGKGACTDVVIRALRAADYDLQKRLHDDMTARWNAYPKTWGLDAPNANIDHRRVPNQMVYLRKYGRELPRQTTGKALQSWQPGDIVYWNTGNSDNTRLHTGIVSDTRNWRGLPYVIHNGSVCQEEDALDKWPIIGHFRFPR